MLTVHHLVYSALALLMAGTATPAQTTGPPASAPPASASEQVTGSPVVRLSSGRVRGLDQGAVRTFSGVRYAQPPVGRLRWAPPKTAEPWPGVADATKPGAACPQAQFPGVPPTDEDCLSVNVTMPRDTGGKRLPVLVWFHGGGFTTGAGSQYDAKRLATQGRVIVVTVNYRLGVFGYFGHEGLAGSGTFAMADQIAALRWTRRNAAALGGDPRKVTVAGQSAGGMSTCALLTSPAAAGLFDRAIISSGSCLIDWPDGGLFPTAPGHTPYASLATTRKDGAALAAKLKCDKGSAKETLDCLRALPATELVPHTQAFADHLTYGTPLLPVHPADALRKGTFHRVPVISGGTRDEMRSFIGGAIMAGQKYTPEQYTELMSKAFGDQADAVAARYPLSAYASPALAWATVITDRSWACPALEGDRLLARRTTVYAFEFGDRDAPNVNGVEVPGFPLGATHATDLPSVFDLGGRYALKTPPQQRLGAQMVGYWAAFARTGDPNGQGAPRWSRFTGKGPVLGLVPDAVKPIGYSADHKCAFWRSIG
ncbi:para-nitrobenzyl esterase [Nonomuraea fuscirosea]|uniref:Para-nitrobenzyl esterase n=1 Tax=Nonomuraea fuscirosea TaxID=1291556 RepID=A0A2T0N5R4_9ACTN|nr:carboxylesterase family protein [Nonomuraea fuscirosea]PRX67723.1 para-nitrobenzyl esterase [Nonomuraea fuscirosea]